MIRKYGIVEVFLLQGRIRMDFPNQVTIYEIKQNYLFG